MEASEQLNTSSNSSVKSFLTYRLSRLHYNLDAHAQAILQKHAELSLVEWRIISLINHDGEATLSSILAASQISEVELHINLQNLIRKAYVVSSQPSPESSTEILTLSPRGQDLYHYLMPHMVIRQTQLAEGLTPAEINALDRILDKLDQASLSMKNSVV